MSYAERVVSNHVILDTVFAFSSPGTILRMSRTCRTVQAIVQSYLRVAFDINRHLSRFLPDPIAFRSLQARTATLISGSNALQFFERTVYPDADMDLYVYKECAEEVGRFLMAAGYDFKPMSNQGSDFGAEARVERLRRTPYPGPVYNVLLFEKLVGDDSAESRRIEIITCLCPFSCVIGSHSTCLMNVISYEKAYALFARATFEERRSIVCTNDDARARLAVDKYGGAFAPMRGIRRALLLSGRSSLRAGLRTVADERSWVLPLNMDGVAAPLPRGAGAAYAVHDPMVLSRWVWDSQPGPFGGACWHATICLFRSELLKYTYVLDEEDMRCAASRFIYLLHKSENRSSKFYDAEFITLCQKLEQNGPAATRDSAIVKGLKNIAKMIVV